MNDLVRFVGFDSYLSGNRSSAIAIHAAIQAATKQNPESPQQTPDGFSSSQSSK